MAQAVLLHSTSAVPIAIAISLVDVRSLCVLEDVTLVAAAYFLRGCVRLCFFLQPFLSIGLVVRPVFGGHCHSGHCLPPTVHPGYRTAAFHPRSFAQAASSVRQARLVGQVSRPALHYSACGALASPLSIDHPHAFARPAQDSPTLNEQTHLDLKHGGGVEQGMPTTRGLTLSEVTTSLRSCTTYIHMLLYIDRLIPSSA